MTFPTLEKPKSNFVIALIIMNVNIKRSERVIENFIRNYFTFTVPLMASTALKICILKFLSNAKHRHNGRKYKYFGRIDLKPFTRKGLNEKEYLYWHKNTVKFTLVFFFFFRISARSKCNLLIFPFLLILICSIIFTILSSHLHMVT